MQPALAEGWSASADGRSLTVKLRPNVKFHDGQPATADVLAGILSKAMQSLLGSVFADIEYVRPSGMNAIEIGFREKSPFLVESLEAPIEKPNGSATGPFTPVPQSTTEFAANQEYYLGRPAVKGVHVESYPSVRAAWADMLRDHTDMLWEVGPDALSSMENSKTVSVFTFTRRYQFLMVLNPDAPSVRSAEVRQALNLAVNRTDVVRNALNGYGVASTGPIWPRYWAARADLPHFQFDPGRAAKIIGRRLRFSCLIPPDAPFERIALEVKRQLAAVGVDMDIRQVSIDELVQLGGKRQYDAMLIELISGPTLVRPYVIWHSKAPFNWGQFGNLTVDTALDRLRHASSDDDLRDAIAGLQRAFMNDPPAVFLAWSQRARAVSRRFVVPTPEPGRDILSNLRLWTPTTALQQASRN